MSFSLILITELHMHMEMSINRCLETQSPAFQ